MIVGVGTHPVTSPEDAVRAIRSAAKDTDQAVALRIVRDGKPRFVAVTPAKAAENQG